MFFPNILGWQVRTASTQSAATSDRTADAWLHFKPKTGNHEGWQFDIPLSLQRNEELDHQQGVPPLTHTLDDLGVALTKLFKEQPRMVMGIPHIATFFLDQNGFYDALHRGDFTITVGSQVRDYYTPPRTINSIADHSIADSLASLTSRPKWVDRNFLSTPLEDDHWLFDPRPSEFHTGTFTPALDGLKFVDGETVITDSELHARLKSAFERAIHSVTNAGTIAINRPDVLVDRLMSSTIGTPFTKALESYRSLQDRTLAPYQAGDVRQQVSAGDPVQSTGASANATSVTEAMDNYVEAKADGLVKTSVESDTVDAVDEE